MCEADPTPQIVSGEDGIDLDDPLQGSSVKIHTQARCRRRIAWYCAGFEIRCPSDSGVQISPSAPTRAYTLSSWNRQSNSLFMYIPCSLASRLSSSWRDLRSRSSFRRRCTRSAMPTIVVMNPARVQPCLSSPSPMFSPLTGGHAGERCLTSHDGPRNERAARRRVINSARGVGYASSGDLMSFLQR